MAASVRQNRIELNYRRAFKINFPSGGERAGAGFFYRRHRAAASPDSHVATRKQKQTKHSAAAAEWK